jgi:hypothetical protein
MRFRFYHLLLFFLLVPYTSHAQYYDTGEDPARLKWMQIRTPHFNVIYPSGYGSEGIRFARSLDESYSRLSSLFPSKNFRIPVIIHNYTTFSNGYVAWAPRRMEVYPTPEQNTIPLDAVSQLTLHEMAHVMQMYSLKKGFSAVMAVLAGEQYTGALSALLPMWFMEGDAVLAESLLSGSGRGRAPSFQNPLKAISLEKNRMYSYDKMLLGSFKNFTPDHYQYGYQMVAWTYTKYDQQLWNKTMEYTARNPFTVVPVNFSLHENANLTKQKLFDETFDSLQSIWKRDEQGYKYSGYLPVNPSKKGKYVSYHSPVSVGKDSVVAIRTSLSKPSSFVLISPGSGTEKRLFTPGSLYPMFLSGSNGKIAWVEQHPDIRWNNRDFSVLKIMDIKSGKVRQLTHSSRIMAASVSPDGRYVAAVENKVNNINSILIIDATDGRVLNTIAMEGNAYPQRPQWSAEGSGFTVISLTEEGEGILFYSMTENKWITLIKPARADLQASFLRNDSLFYISSFSGTDNIYILSPERQISRLTSSRFGTYDLFPEGNSLYFTDYTSDGNNICRVPVSAASPLTGDEPKTSSFLIDRFDTLRTNDSSGQLSDYQPVPYRKWLHPLNVHSWMPFYADIDKIQSDPTAVSPGLTLMSQNNLSTIISTLGYEYSGKEHYLHSKLTWKGWYPVIESQLDYGGKPQIIKVQDTNPDPSSANPALKFTNTIYLPFSFSTGKFTQYLQLSLSSSYENRYIYRSATMPYDYGQTQVYGRIYFSNYHKSAVRDIYPRYAQILDFIYTLYPFDRSLYGDMTTVKTALYFPGFFTNHGIKLRFESERQNPVKYILYNRASFPRTYENLISQSINFWSVDYAMPLFCPDLNIPGLLYIKRFRGGLFWDAARISKTSFFTPTVRIDHNYSETIQSFGFELLSDFFVIRVPFMISGGIQTAWHDPNEKPAFKFLLRIDIYGMKVGTHR